MFRFLNKMSLRSKLFSLTGALLLVSVVMGYFGQSTAGKINGVVIAMQNKQAAVDAVATQAAKAMALVDQVWTESTKAIGKNALRSDLIAQFTKEHDEIGKALSAAESLPSLAGKDKDDVREIKNKWNDLGGSLSRVTGDLGRNAARSTVEPQLLSVTQSMKELSDRMSSVRASIFDSTLEQVVEAAEASAKNRNLLFAVAPIFAVMSLVAFVFARSVASSLMRVGDSLLNSAGEIQGTSQQISVIGQALSEITTEQSTAVEETVASMEEMSSMMGLTSNNAQSAMRSAEETQTKADEGVKTIDRLKDSMTEINHANEKLEEINSVIEEINEKTKIINDIVAETRMLSFNASIEAARAGEHGRGFAVVAEQIGNLAKMSGKAAQEIRMLIAKSTSQVNQSINFTQDKVKVGQKISEDCAAAFGKITENIRHLSPIVNAIASAASQQETGISQTNKAMQQMDLVTNKNLKRASEAAQAGKRLEDQYGLLANAIEALNQIVFGLGEGQAPVHYSTRGPGGSMGGLGGRGFDGGGGTATKIVGKIARAAKGKATEGGRQAHLQEDPSHGNDLPSPDDSRFGS